MTKDHECPYCGHDTFTFEFCWYQNGTKKTSWTCANCNNDPRDYREISAAEVGELVYGPPTRRTD